MASVRRQFGGLNTDLSVLKVPSGTASALLNVVIEDGKLKKRMGFCEYFADVNGATSIDNLWVSHHDAGDWLIAKVGTAFYRYRVSLPVDADFSLIGTPGSHAAGAGFAFDWMDWMVFGSSGGVFQWHPTINGGYAYKAGLPKPAMGPEAAATGAGEKEGRYHAHFSYYCSQLDVEGVVSEPSKGGAIETRVSASQGGLTVSPKVSIPWGYYTDKLRVYCTMGDTELVQVGGNSRETFSYRAYMDAEVANNVTPGLNKADKVLDPYTIFNNRGGEPPASRLGAWNGVCAVYVAGDEGVKAAVTITQEGAGSVTFTATAAGTWGNAISIAVTNRTDTNPVPVVTVDRTVLGDGFLARNGIRITIQVNNGTGYETTADDVVAAFGPTTEAGNLVSAVAGAGLFTGTCAETFLMYGVDSTKSSVWHSVPGRPTMVPQKTFYQATTSGGATDMRTITPRPWEGRITSGVEGSPVALTVAGGSIVLYTGTATYRLRSGGNGQLFPVAASRSHGAVGEKAVCGLGSVAYALGAECWTLTTEGQFEDLAQGRFRNLLKEVNPSKQYLGVMASHPYRNQVWAAVSKDNSAYAQRIIVLDKQASHAGEVLVWEPAMLDADEGITAMRELAFVGGSPVMLIGTSKGRIFFYPHNEARDWQASGYSDYIAYHRSHWGQEVSDRPGQIQGVEIHCGANCQGNVTLRYRAKRSAGDNPTQTSKPISRSDGLESVGAAMLGKVDCRLIELEFYSAEEDTGQWEIHDVSVKIAPTS